MSKRKSSVPLLFTKKRKLNESAKHVHKITSTIHTMIGTRENNEDRAIVGGKCGEWNIWGVFDGHGGDQVSQFLGQEFCKFAQDLNFGRDLKVSSIRKLFIEIDTFMYTHFFDAKSMTSPGSTAVVCFHNAQTNKLLIANLGDSEAILFNQSNGQILASTTKHTPQNNSEQERVIEAGGYLFSGVYVSYHPKGVGAGKPSKLAVTRAFGDFLWKNDFNGKYSPERAPVVAIPDVYEFDLSGETEYSLVIATDGLWNHMSHKEVIEFCLQGCEEKESIAEKLLLHCNSKAQEMLKSTKHKIDNSTVVIVQFNKQ